jgi:hypothetical protein
VRRLVHLTPVLEMSDEDVIVAHQLHLSGLTDRGIIGSGD